MAKKGVLVDAKTAARQQLRARFQRQVKPEHFRPMSQAEKAARYRALANEFEISERDVYEIVQEIVDELEIGARGYRAELSAETIK